MISQFMEFARPNVLQDNLQEMRTTSVYPTAEITTNRYCGVTPYQKPAKQHPLTVLMATMLTMLQVCALFP